MVLVDWITRVKEDVFSDNGQIYKKPKSALSVEVYRRASVWVFEIFNNGLFDWEPACRAPGTLVEVS